MPTIDLADARYWYQAVGMRSTRATANSRPILLLHGFTGSSAGWDEVAAELTRPAIALDLPGHGATQVPLVPARFAMERVAADLAACIQTLAAEPVHLLGYSMGGRLALYLAVYYPELVASLILESSSPGLEDAADRAARQAADNALAQRIAHEGVESFLDYWETLPIFAGRRTLPAATQQQLRARQRQNTADGLATSLRGMGTGVQPSLWDKLADLTMPVLLMTGELDGKFVAVNHRMQQCIPSSRHVIIKGAGHTIHLEQPDAYCSEVNAFLARHKNHR